MSSEFIILLILGIIAIAIMSFFFIMILVFIVKFIIDMWTEFFIGEFKDSSLIEKINAIAFGTAIINLFIYLLSYYFYKLFYPV